MIRQHLASHQLCSLKRSPMRVALSIRRDRRRPSPVSASVFAFLKGAEQGNNVIRCEDRMSKRRSVDFICRMHGFSTRSRLRFFHKGHMVSELHAKATGRFYTFIGEHANEHETLDSMLLELSIQVGVRKTALCPMLFDHNIAFLDEKIGMEFTGPASFRKHLILA